MFLTLKLLKLIRESKAEEWVWLADGSFYNHPTIGDITIARYASPPWLVWKNRGAFWYLSYWLIKRALNKKLLERNKSSDPAPIIPKVIKFSELPHADTNGWIEVKEL